MFTPFTAVPTPHGRGLLVLAVASIAIAVAAHPVPRSAEPAMPLAEASPAPPLPAFTLDGRLLDDNEPLADCGIVEVWTVLRFDVSSDLGAPRADPADALALPVAIPCPELPRSSYDAGSGNVGVLVRGERYRLTLEAPRSSGKWGSATAWAAIRIDDLSR